MKSTLALCLVSLSLAIGPGIALGQSAGPGATGSADARLGSPDCRPTPERPIGWRGDGTGRYPGATPPLAWSRTRAADGGWQTTGIVWAARLPHASVASPIVVGDRIFVTSEVNDLACLDKRTGRVLWLRSSAEFEGLPAGELGTNAVLAGRLEPLMQELARTNDAVVAALNAGQEKGIDSAVAAKRAIEKRVQDIQLSVDKKKFERYWGQAVFGFSGPTPTSDGRRVYVFYTTGIVACYDLDGKRLWIHRGRGGCSEHGNFASPLLCGNRLAVWAAELRGYDAETGAVAWTNPAHAENTYGSLFRVDSGGEAVAAFQSGYFTRVRDGKAIWGEMAFGNATATPIVENGTIYAWVGYPRNAQGLGFKAYPVPAATDDAKLKPAFTFTIDWAGDELPADKDKHPFDRSYTASPLFVDGLIYQLTEGGGLTVNDAATGALVYRKVLALKPRTQYWNWAGASASPTLAGRYIYLFDNQGSAIILKPGRTYEEAGRNELQEFSDGKTQELNLTTPVFEGRFLYYRTPRCLYCIGGP